MSYEVSGLGAPLELNGELMGPDGGNILTKEQKIANASKIMSRSMKGLFVYLDTFDMETKRKVEAGEVKMRDSFLVHTARIRGGQGNTSIPLLRQDNRRRVGISDFDVTRLPKGVNAFIDGLGFAYATKKTLVPLTLTDEQIEDQFAATLLYNHQRTLPSLTTFDYNESFDLDNGVFESLIPNILQHALLSISVGGKLEHESTVEQFLLDSLNATPGVLRDGALQLGKGFMLREDTQVTMDLTFPVSSSLLPTSTIITSAWPATSPPIGGVIPAPGTTVFIEHFVKVYFYGTIATPIR